MQTEQMMNSELSVLDKSFQKFCLHLYINAYARINARILSQYLSTMRAQFDFYLIEALVFKNSFLKEQLFLTFFVESWLCWRLKAKSHFWKLKYQNKLEKTASESLCEEAKRILEKL